MCANTIQLIEKENPKRIKNKYNTLTVKINPQDSTIDFSSQTTLKIPKPLVKKVEGPFNEEGELVEEMIEGETYIFKATGFQKSPLTPIKHIWWAEQIDDGEITDLEYKKDENPYLDDKKVLSFKYEAKNAEKVRIYAYVSNPIKSASIESSIQIEVDSYLQAIRDKKIVYSCNCGWIDKTHAFTDTVRTEYYIGAKNLWTQILSESGVKSNSPKEKGFKVTYRQDATIIQSMPLIDKPLRIGKTKSYFVKSGLSIKQKESVALAIFEEVSVEFEEFQSFGAVIGRGDSSFEPADLISNLLSFYRVLRPELTKEVLLDKAEALTPEQSEEVYKQYPGTFTDKKYKNKKFTPRYFPNQYCNKPPVFPKELQSIIPAEKNDLFRDWIPLFDVQGGKPSMIGSKI